MASQVSNISHCVMDGKMKEVVHAYLMGRQIKDNNVIITQHGHG